MPFADPRLALAAEVGPPEARVVLSPDARLGCCDRGRRGVGGWSRRTANSLSRRGPRPAALGPRPSTLDS